MITLPQPRPNFSTPSNIANFTYNLLPTEALAVGPASEWKRMDFSPEKFRQALLVVSRVNLSVKTRQFTTNTIYSGGPPDGVG